MTRLLDPMGLGGAGPSAQNVQRGQIHKIPDDICPPLTGPTTTSTNQPGTVPNPVSTNQPTTLLLEQLLPPPQTHQSHQHTDHGQDQATGPQGSRSKGSYVKSHRITVPDEHGAHKVESGSASSSGNHSRPKRELRYTGQDTCSTIGGSSDDQATGPQGLGGAEPSAKYVKLGKHIGCQIMFIT